MKFPKKDMDLAWDICMEFAIEWLRYLISAFMGHNASEDVLESLNPIVIEKNHTNIYRWSKYQLEVSRTL